MTTTLAPADEACLALVDRINAGTTYVLDARAEYSRQIVDPLEEIVGLRVDVEHSSEQRQSEMLDGLDQTLHTINVWIRSKLPSDIAEEDEDAVLRSYAYLRKQIIDRLDNWNSDDRRVQVWELDNEDFEQPTKDALRQIGLFVAKIVLNVQVAP